MSVDDLNDVAFEDVTPTVEHPAATPDQLALLQWAADHPIDRPTLPINGRRQYQAIPPGGTKAKGHTRASTFAKSLSDDAGLTTWRHRLLAAGLGRINDELIAVAVGAEERDDAQIRRDLNRVIAKALHVAGEKLAADIGAALHTAIEHALSGSEHIAPDPWHADVTATLRPKMGG